GWDVLRECRMRRLRELDILDDSASLSDRDPTQPAWDKAEYKEWQARRMEVYAAQIDRMDQGVGQILGALAETHDLENTLVVFLWPKGGLLSGSVVRVPAQLVDVLPTVLEATGSSYPAEFKARAIIPYEGRSLLPALRGESVPEATLYWEHTGNAAVRRGQWKLVRAHTEVKRYWGDRV